MAVSTKPEDAVAAAKAAANAATEAAADAEAKARNAKDLADKSKAARDAAAVAVAKAAEDPDNAGAKEAADSATAFAHEQEVAAAAAAEAADAASRLATDAAARAAEPQKAAAAAAQPDPDPAANGPGTVDPSATDAPRPMGSTSYYDLLKAVVNDPRLTGEEKKAILEQLNRISPTSDRLTYRTAILILGLLAVVAIVATWTIALQNLEIPQGLIAIASGAVGGLAGLLAPARSSDPHAP